MAFLSRSFAFLFLSGLAACSPATESPPSYSHNAGVSDAHGRPRDTTTFYFPAADSLHAAYFPADQRPRAYVLNERVMNCADDLVSASHCLTYFHAPVLSNHYLQVPIYRFLWLRSFHRPVLLTLRGSTAGATLHTQALDKFPSFHTLTVLHPDSLPADASAGTREYTRRFYEEMMADPAFHAQVAAGKRRAVLVPEVDTTVALTPQQYQDFERLLHQARFWQLPSCQPKPGLLDGASWLLEAHLASGYHMVERASPSETDPFRQVCEHLIELSSVRAEERY